MASLTSDAAILEKGLGGLRRCVGETPDAGAYVFTTLCLPPPARRPPDADDADSGHRIVDISSVSRFSELTQLSLPGQQVQDLSPLAALPFLAELNCSGNDLATSLDATAAPWCRLPANANANGDGNGELTKATLVAKAWSSGDRFIGSQLEIVNLSHNAIPGPLGDHSSHRFLRFLDLSHNTIDVLGPGLSKLWQLRTLSLAGNGLARIEEQDLPPFLTDLDISQNVLESIAFCENLPSLEVLRVDENRVSTVESLSHCAQLRVCHLRGNLVSSFEAGLLCALRDAEHLQSLTVLGNPVAAVDFYRLRLIRMLPQLTELDAKPVLPEDKVKSDVLVGSEHPERMATWAKYIGKDVPFEDTVPAFVVDTVDDEEKVRRALAERST